MRIGLMESERKRERHGRGMASSVVVHAAVIGLAWYGTARATVARSEPVIATPIHFLAPSRRTTATTGGSGRPGGIRAPTRIPAHVPPIPVGPVTVHAPLVSWDSLVGAPNDWGSGHDAGARRGSPEQGADGVFRTVDVMAVPDTRNPAPVYPSMLRDAGVEGSVSAQFVVDSTGRVAASSIAFLDGGNAVFQQSVRRALEAARFSPAQVGGHAVRVLMAQTFEFRLRH